MMPNPAVSRPRGSLPYSATQALEALLRQNFLAFAMRAFSVVNPDKKLDMNWHLDAMCHALQTSANTPADRLIIEVPPRHLKSFAASIAFTAWLLGRNPSLKILVASYGSELAEEHDRQTRNLMSSDFYKSLFPATRIVRARNGELMTSLGEMRKAVSVGGATTGFGADYIIIDDLIKASDAQSNAELWRVQEYLTSTLITRLNNPSDGRIICVQQRLSEMDPAGFLKDKGSYRTLSLLSVASRHERIELTGGKSHTRNVGDLLFPQRYDQPTLNRIETEMGSTKFSAQHLQNPTPPGGNRLRREWFKSYDFEPARERFTSVIQSWDTAQSDSQFSDYSVCTTWGLTEETWHLIDLYWGRTAYHELKDYSLALIARWKPDRVFIEQAASGHSLLSDLRSRGMNLRDTVFGTKPTISKLERFDVAVSHIKDGQFALPACAPWLEGFTRELLAFPNGSHDDQVDSVSQFVLWVRDKPPAGSGRRRVQRGSLVRR